VTLVSELLTNALQASWTLPHSPPVILRMLASQHALVIEAWDQCVEGYDLSYQPTDNSEHGRGLMVVAALSTACLPALSPVRSPAQGAGGVAGRRPDLLPGGWLAVAAGLRVPALPGDRGSPGGTDTMRAAGRPGLVIRLRSRWTTSPTADRRRLVLSVASPGHDDLDLAFLALAGPIREAILQPPKPQLRPFARILERARERQGVGKAGH
jgi:hypothetical protein